VLEPAKIADDRRESRRDDGLVERRDEHAEQEPGEDDQGSPLAEWINSSIIHSLRNESIDDLCPVGTRPAR
jgi:hypothetical protein